MNTGMGFKNKFKNLSGYCYIFPIMIILISFYIIPLLMSLYFSFTKYNIMSPAKFIGFENYKSLFSDSIFKISLYNNVIFVLVVVPVQTALSFLLAVFITTWESKSKLAKLSKIVIFIPVISSMMLVGIIWRILLNGDTSLVNNILSFIGVNTNNWLGNPKTALPALMMISVWKNIGIFTVIYIAALMDIPKSYYEAARVDGAGKIYELVNITVPLLKSTHIMALFLGSIWSFQIFDLIYSMTGGGPGMATMTLVMHIYNLSFKQFNSGYSMAVANVLFLIVAVITIVQKKFFKKENSMY